MPARMGERPPNCAEGTTAAPTDSEKEAPGKRKRVGDPIRPSRRQPSRGVKALVEMAAASATAGLCSGRDRMADSHSARGIDSTLSPMAVTLNEVLVIFRLRADSPCLWRKGVRSAIVDCAVLSGAGQASRGRRSSTSRSLKRLFSRRRRSVIRLAGRLRRCRVIGSV